jgi:ankyrin repeat protein
VHLKTITSAARRGIEKMISLTPMFVSMLLLLHCSVQEDFVHTEQELLVMPLLNAAEAGDVHQVKLLLDHGANIEEGNYYGLTALHRASEEGRLQVVKLLLSRGADVSAQDCDGGRALEKAAQQGHGRTVALLAAWGADLSYRDSMGCTLLMRAAEWGWIVVLHSLLQDGKVDVNDSDLFGETALHKAAKQGRRNIVDALIRYGADISAKCSDGHTLVTWAIRNHWGDLLNLLLTSSSPSKEDLTLALVAAVKRGMVPETQVLVHAGADVAHRDSQGNTLLMRAAALGYAEVMRVLLKAYSKLKFNAEVGGGALVDATNTRGQSALMLAAERDDGHGCVRMLLHARAAVNLQDHLGETALIKSARLGNVQTVRARGGGGYLLVISGIHVYEKSRCERVMRVADAGAAAALKGRASRHQGPRQLHTFAARCIRRPHRRPHRPHKPPPSHHGAPSISLPACSLSLSAPC